MLKCFKVDERTFGTPSELGLKLHKDVLGREVNNNYFTSTRPNIINDVSMINRYMEHPMAITMQVI